MKKYIVVTKGALTDLQKIFNVGERCVKNALAFRSKSTLAKKIRIAAKEKGGQVYCVTSEFECMFDSDLSMHQLFPNYAEIYCDKETGEVTLYHKGKVLERWPAILTTELFKIQKRAAAL